jgi:hypothetical protein
MPIRLKDWSEDDPDLGKLWVSLLVTLPESTDDSEPPFENVLVQPNIPNRGQRTAAAQKRAEPQPEEEQ